MGVPSMATILTYQRNPTVNTWDSGGYPRETTALDQKRCHGQLPRLLFELFPNDAKIKMRKT